jgi:hypothetical protein
MGFFSSLIDLAVSLPESTYVEPSAIVCEIERNDSYECKVARDISDASNAQDALDAINEEKRS